jgi:hypothetical protein
MSEARNLKSHIGCLYYKRSVLKDFHTTFLILNCSTLRKDFLIFRSIEFVNGIFAFSLSSFVQVFKVY